MALATLPITRAPRKSVGRRVGVRIVLLTFVPTHLTFERTINFRLVNRVVRLSHIYYIRYICYDASGFSLLQEKIVEGRVLLLLQSYFC